MKKDWKLFRKAVEEYLGPILAEYGFKEQTGPEFEPDERRTVQYAISYQDDKGHRMGTDIQKMQLYRDGWINFFWLRMDVGSDNLKSLRVPPPKTRDEVLEADGWVIHDIKDMDSAMKEMAEVLKEYLDKKFQNS